VGEAQETVFLSVKDNKF